LAEKLAHDIEYSQIQLKVAEGLKKGNVALEKANSLFRYHTGAYSFFICIFVKSKRYLVT
jgi:hypothetical protein